MRSDPMGRIRLVVFAILGVLFLLATMALRHWGRDWAMAVYRPLLLETVADACATQQSGKAERVALQALRTSPGYAAPIRDAVADDLVVMPQLRATLADIFGSAPKAQEALAPHFVVQQTDAADSPRSRYCKALADLELGHRDAAQTQLAALTAQGLELPDAAYRLGALYEMERQRPQALDAYARALLASDAHLDAAVAYLRVSGRASAPIPSF